MSDTKLTLGDGDGDYRGDADDPPALAYLEVGGVQPQS